MKLIIEIELGNDAMRNNQHVKECLLNSRMLAPESLEDYHVGECGALYDTNGNKVGFWKVRWS
jgi:hypothetical protein